MSTSRNRRAATGLTALVEIVGGPIHSGRPVPFTSVCRNPRNPRTTFRPIDSMRAVGQLDSIKVVQRNDADGTEYYLVTDGERRHRTAESLGWSHVGIEVVDLTDEQIEIAMLAYGTGADPLSPLDEALHIARLAAEYHWPATEIALRIGRNESDVRRALALHAIVPELRALVASESLLASDALVYARLSEVDQRKAAAQLADSDWVANGERIAAKFVRTHVRRWMLSLADPGFDVADATLAPRGSCVTCPMRTSNQTALAGFGDVDSDDRCTDAACFEAKRAATWDRTRAAVPQAKPLEGPEARRALAGQGYRPATAGEAPAALARDDDGRTHALVAVAPVPAPTKRAPAASANVPTSPHRDALTTAQRNAMLDRVVANPTPAALVAGLSRLARPEWIREIAERRVVESLTDAARGDDGWGVVAEIAGMLDDGVLRAMSEETTEQSED